MANILQKLSDEQKEKIVDLIVERKRVAKNSTSAKEVVWERCQQYYRGYQRKDKKMTWKNNIFVPISFEMIETIVPMTAISLLSIHPLIGILPEGPDDVYTAPNMEAIIDYQLSQKEVQFKLKFSNFLRDCYVMGTGVLKITPKYENGNYRIPIVENIDRRDFFIQPRAISVKDADYCGVVYTKTVQYLLRNFNISPDDYEKIINSMKQISSDRWYKDDSRSATDPTTIEPEVIEYYGYLKLDDTPIEKKYMATVINDKVLIQIDDDVDRPPFIVLPDLPMSNEIDGIGRIEPILDLQYEINKKRNQRLDNIDDITQVMWGVLNNSGVDISQLVARPNGIIMYDTPDAVREFRFPNVTEALNIEVERLINDVKNALGITPGVQGRPPERVETAAGQITQLQAASVRFKWDSELKNDLGVEEIGNLLSYYNQKYCKGITIRKILGKDKYEFPRYTPAEIMGNYSFRASGSSEEGIGNVEIRKANFLKYFNLLMSVPPQLTRPDGRLVYIDQTELVKRLIDVMGEKQPEKILIESEIAPIKEGQPSEEEEAIMKAIAEEEGLSAEEQKKGIAPPITGIVPQKDLRPAGSDAMALARSLGHKIS